VGAAWDNGAIEGDEKEVGRGLSESVVATSERNGDPPDLLSDAHEAAGGVFVASSGSSREPPDLLSDTHEAAGGVVVASSGSSREPPDLLSDAHEKGVGDGGRTREPPHLLSGAPDIISGGAAVATCSRSGEEPFDLLSDAPGVLAGESCRGRVIKVAGGAAEQESAHERGAVVTTGGGRGSAEQRDFLSDSGVSSVPGRVEGRVGEGAGVLPAADGSPGLSEHSRGLLSDPFAIDEGMAGGADVKGNCMEALAVDLEVTSEAAADMLLPNPAAAEAAKGPQLSPLSL
jgi:hypothetical protein